MSRSRLEAYETFLYRLSRILCRISVSVSLIAAVFFYPPFHIFWEAVRLPVKPTLEVCTVCLFASSAAYLLMSLKKRSLAAVTAIFLACVTVSAAVSWYSLTFAAYTTFPYVVSCLDLCFLPLFAVSRIAEKVVISGKGNVAAAVLGLLQTVLTGILFFRSLSASVLTGIIQYLYFIPFIAFLTPPVLLSGADKLTVPYRFSLLAASLFLPLSLIRIADTVLFCRIVPFYAGLMTLLLTVNNIYYIFHTVKEHQLWQTS